MFAVFSKSLAIDVWQGSKYAPYPSFAPFDPEKKTSFFAQ